MDARRLRFGVMLAAALGVVGLALALALGASREGEQAGAQGAVPTTAPAAALPANPPRCTATTLGGSRTANAALAADCDALLALETTLAGTGVGRRELNWAPGRALTSWKGVTVRGTPKRVAKLYLHGSGLSGAIPTQLGSLTALTELNLSWNRLSGAIPTQLGSLTKLTKLYLYGNWLTGAIPTQLGSLPKLRHLYLYANRLTGSIPPQLGSLTALETLELSGNRLTGAIPTELGNLTKLRTLALSGNTLTGCVPEALRRATTNDLARLGLPYCLKLIALSDGTARELILEWTATATGVTSWQYRLQGPFFGGRSGDWGAWTTVVSGQATTRTHRLRNLANYKGYYVQVRGVGAGVSYISNEAVGVTPKVGSDGIPVMSAGAIYTGGRQYRLSGTHYVITIPVNARIMMGGAALDDGVFIVSIIDTSSEKWMIIDSDTGTVLERPQRSRSGATGASDSAEDAVNDLFDQIATSIQRVVHP